MHELILVVDDEPKIVKLTRDYLEKDGFRVISAGDGEAALAAARRERPDLVVLDLMLPGMDGLEVCRELKKDSQTERIPIVMLTAKGEESDIVTGLELGADDYVTKPFSPRELVARIRTLLRRPRSAATGTPDPDQLQRRVFADLVIDVPAREVRVGSRLVALTRTEHDLLETLSGRPRVVFTRQQLLDAVWDSASSAVPGDEHLVDIHIGHLRQKLGDDPRSPRYVLTVRGVGYRMGEG